jgi:hypothetical protein
MKKLMLFAGFYCLQLTLHAGSFPNSGINHLAPVNASDRARAHLKAHFKGTDDAAWFNLDDKDMYCLFHQGDTMNRVYYDKHGYWLYTLLSYPGYDLPQPMKKELMDNFKCYQISSVNEVRSNNYDPVYVVNIENDDNIKVVKVVGDEFEVQQDLKKR